MNKSEGRPIEILLVEDSPSDTDLTLEALKDFKVRNHVSVVEDGVLAYQLNANCYVNKPVDFNQFLEVVRSIEAFWLFVVTLPPAPKAGG
jgi:hypothetical protein